MVPRRLTLRKDRSRGSAVHEVAVLEEVVAPVHDVEGQETDGVSVEHESLQPTGHYIPGDLPTAALQQRSAVRGEMAVSGVESYAEVGDQGEISRGQEPAVVRIVRLSEGKYRNER